MYKNKEFVHQVGKKKDSHCIIPQTEAVKYLGQHFDCRLNWKEHIA